MVEVVVVPLSVEVVPFVVVKTVVRLLSIGVDCEVAVPAVVLVVVVVVVVTGVVVDGEWVVETSIVDGPVDVDR